MLTHARFKGVMFTKMLIDNRGNIFANVAICILFIWAISIIVFAILINVYKGLAIYPGIVASLAGMLGAPIAFLFSTISCIKRPRKRGFFIMPLSILVFLVSLRPLSGVFVH